MNHTALARPAHLAIVGLLGLLLSGIANDEARAQEVKPAGSAPLVAAEKQTEIPPGPLPMQVSVGFFLIDFARINGREETFDLTGVILEQWRDSRLALPAGAPARGTRTFEPDKIWVPELGFVNAMDQVRIHHEFDLTVADDGTVTRRFQFSGKFSTPMDVRRFPFDTQDLLVIVKARDLEEDQLKFTVDAKHAGFGPEAFLSDWDIEDVGGTIESSWDFENGPTFSEVRFDVRIARRYTFYCWRVLLPLTMLVIASWTVFWFEPTGLQPQISTALAILMSVVVFNFSIDFALPKATYLNIIERHALTVFLFVFAAIMAITFIHVTLNRYGLERTLRYQRVLRWAFPLVFLITVTIQVLLFVFAVSWPAARPG